MKTKTEETTRKYKLSSDTVNYLASSIDVSNGDSILYHKLNGSLFHLARQFGFTPKVSLTGAEVKTLLAIIEPRITGRTYCCLSDKEMLRIAKEELNGRND